LVCGVFFKSRQPFEGIGSAIFGAPEVLLCDAIEGAQPNVWVARGRQVKKLTVPACRPRSKKPFSDHTIQQGANAAAGWRRIGDPGVNFTNGCATASVNDPNQFALPLAKSFKLFRQ